MLKSAPKHRQSLLAPAKVARVAGHLVGSIVAFRDGHPLVTYPDNAHGPLAARSTVPLLAVLSQPLPEPVAALLVFEEERSNSPVIVGVLQEMLHTATAPEPAKQLTARVDGKRVVIEANDEIELRCGKASIVLRKNGRVVIRGAYVETRAEGVNRIKGGSVQVN